MPSPAAELLAGLDAAFDRLGLRWYLFGAQAVIAYGTPRLTADADVTVELGSRTSTELVAELETHGFELRVSDAAEFVRRTRVLPFVHVPTDFPVDVVLAGPGPEELFLERARRTKVGDVVVPLIAPEDLIAVKILAGRPQDLLDVAGVLRAQSGELNLDLVRETLSVLQRALDRSDLIAELERLVRQVGR